jgi:hypothetical protein
MSHPTSKELLARLRCVLIGHVEFGSHFGLPLAHCSRCGARTRFSIPGWMWRP